MLSVKVRVFTTEPHQEVKLMDEDKLCGKIIRVSKALANFSRLNSGEIFHSLLHLDFPLVR